MSMDFKFLNNLTRDTIKKLDMYSDSAQQLMLGTFAVESDFGTHLHQLNGGPALGIGQMEPRTFHSLIDNYLHYRNALFDKIMYICRFDHKPNSIDLVTNTSFAICMTRIKYWKIKEQLPESHDVQGLASYWKRYYNTPAGLGTEEKFIEKYYKYVR